MTNAEVLEFCQEAYWSLTSYHGKVAVETDVRYREGTGLGQNGRPMPLRRRTRLRSDAEIWFSSPGRMRIRGNLDRSARLFVYPREPFEIVCDGSGTWSRWPVSKQRWESRESLDSAISAFTGVSGGACTTIPRLLLGLGLRKADDNEAESVTTDGRAVWRVVVQRDICEDGYWIDRESGLLLRYNRVQDERHRERMQHHFAEVDQWVRNNTPPSDVPGMPYPPKGEANFNLLSTVVFATPRCDTELPDSLFRGPEGAPE